ncbi:helix-turn-helix transcriptional regulator [Aliivibrio salmonicida]|uniref:helix-turn-helix transcriptional regulator n=1 Tax=Aliivibrio salmonicida TaxID=40269 RepID=UPI003D0E42C8
MQIDFSIFLQQLRAEMDLTQQDLLDILIDENNLFNKLDLTTLSRWERSITTPTLKKQLFIARLFNSDISQLIKPEISISNTKKQSLDQYKERIVNPYSGYQNKLGLTKLLSFENKEHIYDCLINFHKNFLKIDISKESFEKKSIEMEINILTGKHGELVGHFLYAYTPMNTPSDLYYPNNLIECPLMKESSISDNQVTLYITSAFSLSSQPRMMILLMIIKILSKNPNIKGLVFKVYNQEALNFININMDYEIINKGSKTSGGVKLYGQNYTYLQLFITTEDFLSAKVISNLIPDMNVHIEKLLNEQL